MTISGLENDKMKSDGLCSRSSTLGLLYRQSMAGLTLRQRVKSLGLRDNTSAVQWHFRMILLLFYCFVIVDLNIN